MPITLTPIASGKSRTPADEIPEDTAQAIEEAFDYCSSNPSMRLQTEPYDTKDEAEKFLKDARSYAYHRKDGKGRLVVTGNPATVKVGDIKKFVARFSVEPYVGKDDDDTDES